MRPWLERIAYEGEGEGDDEEKAMVVACMPRGPGLGPLSRDGVN